MRLKTFTKLCIKLRRWLFLGFIGFLLFISGIISFGVIRPTSLFYIVLNVFLMSSGAYIMYIALSQGLRSMYSIIDNTYLDGTIHHRRLINLMYEKRLHVKGPKIVVIGGGTGLSTMLRGLKGFTSNITAIVTVGDDGGGSGVLREDLGILPPGDIRNCILALADTEPTMEKLIQYRFKEGWLKNQSFGNLFLAAMNGISDNFMEAVKKMSSVLAVTGKVLPVTLDNMRLKAKLKNGQIIEGESNIPKGVIENNSNIEKVFIEPTNAKALKEAIDAIKDADAVVLGPGSLYTSVIPNLLVNGISDALNKTDALKLYVSNIMTQKGETDKFTVKDHIEAVFNHSGKNIIDYVIVNTGKISKSFEERYLEEHARIVEIDEEEINKLNVKVIKADFVKIRKGYVRHDPEKLAAILMETIMEKKLLYDRKKILEYFYLSETSKQNK